MRLLVIQGKRIMLLALRPVPRVKRWRQRTFLPMLSVLLSTLSRRLLLQIRQISKPRFQRNEIGSFDAFPKTFGSG